ncbi:hypothetical protein O3M35_010471 [Rhynocoris fuscipes]|uniref:Uncharacterized protein n=1 Tax=Rhynocoris fuscipes TaxID=488301 RepID=A0AAW1CYZ6_9HEMI
MLISLTKKLLPNLNCVTFITDSYYNFMINNEIFYNFRNVPILKVLVHDYEDLLSPNLQTLSVIQLAQLKGCDAYFILIANADQTSRFLRFGDRHRVLDTRAMYIMLYDSRLFRKELYYLWRKVINVIFIRKFLEVPRYEFTTVPFPYIVNTKLIPESIDTWRSGKFQKDKNLFFDKTSNLKNNTLRVTVFEHMPSVVKLTVPASQIDQSAKLLTNSADEYGGLEVQILKSLSEAMNFQILFYEPTNADVEAWGRKQLNGTYSGILGEIIAGKCDMALGNFLYTPYNLEHLDLSRPYTTQCFTFLTPESTNDNSWKTLILPFKVNMWIAIIFTLLVGSIIFYGLAKYHLFLEQNGIHLQSVNYKFWKDLFKLWHNEKSKNFIQIKKINNSTFNISNYSTGLYLFKRIDDSLLSAYSTLLLVSLPKMPTGWSLRMFTGWWWIYCILVTVSYRASMTAILAHPAPKVTIDTLEELAASPIGCGGWGEQNKNFFTTALDVAGQRVGKKFEVTYDSDSAIAKVFDGGYAYYENIYFLLHAKVKQKLKLLSQRILSQENNVTTDSGGKDLHIMGDCVINMPISIGLQKNSPLKPRVDIFLQRVIEAGLIKKWLGDVMTSTAAAEAPLNKVQIKALMNLKKFSGALVALFCGYILGIIMLSIENIYWYYYVVKHPLYDKYAKN